MEQFFEGLGEVLAVLYFGYGLLVLAGGSVVCLHLLVLGLLWRRRDDMRWRFLARSVEIVYGLVNPCLYLLFLQRVFELPATPWLTASAWAILAGVWGFRLCGGAERLRATAPARQAARGMLALALAAVAVFLAKDAWWLTHSPESFPRGAGAALGALYLLNVGALYAAPVLALLRQLRSTASADAWARGDQFYLLSPRLAIGAAALTLATAVAWQVPRSTAAVKGELLGHRTQIVEAAERHGLDPRLIAAVLYVIRRDLSTPFARQLERAAMGAWLTDQYDDAGLARRLDLSVGFGQIKPQTALTALRISQVATLSAAMSLEDRSGAPGAEVVWTLPTPAVQALRPAFSGPVSREQIVADLFDDRLNIEMCALILALYAIQWESADPAWSLREKPEILATLYQLGFERSSPKASPRPDRFGERVRAVYDGAWMKAEFGPPPSAAPTGLEPAAPAAPPGAEAQRQAEPGGEPHQR